MLVYTRVASIRIIPKIGVVMVVFKTISSPKLKIACQNSEILNGMTPRFKGHQ